MTILAVSLLKGTRRTAVCALPLMSIQWVSCFGRPLVVYEVFLFLWEVEVLVTAEASLQARCYVAQSTPRSLGHRQAFAFSG